MSKEDSKNGFYRIRRIKDTSFFVNENLFKANHETGTLKVDIQQGLGFSIDKNILDLKTRVKYRYPESTKEDIPLAQIEVQNVFEVIGLSAFLSDNKLKLPQELIINLVSLSISHTRALLSKNLSGTVFQDEIMSVIDPENLAKHFYPYMFQDTLESESHKNIETNPE